MAELTTRTANEVRAHATVVQASGFAGSALRSVLTAIFSMSGSTYPKKVFADLESASSWLAEGSVAQAQRLRTGFHQLDTLRQTA